jgi:hypothetical protein
MTLQSVPLPKARLPKAGRKARRGPPLAALDKTAPRTEREEPEHADR